VHRLRLLFQAAERHIPKCQEIKANEAHRRGMINSKAKPRTKR
jgi:hypothetical protein